MRALLIALLALCLAGCGSMPGGKSNPALIQQALDFMLPPNFKGDVHIDHSNPYFGFTLAACNLRHGDAGWEFDWLIFDRHGFSRGRTVLGKPPLLLP